MGIQAISSDVGASTNVSSSTQSSTGDFAAVLGNVGGAVTGILDATGNSSAATIAAVSTNATYGGLLSAGGSSLSTTGSSLSTGAQYLTGTTSSLSTSTSTTGTDVESILQDSAMSQAYLIGIQAQMGMQQTTFTSISNAMNVKTSMEKEAIRNFKA